MNNKIIILLVIISTLCSLRLLALGMGTEPQNNFPIIIQSEKQLLFSGKWGKSVDELGLVVQVPNIMPNAPYSCIGGYDVDSTGAVCFSDSVNKSIKCNNNDEWLTIPIAAQKLGDIAWFGGKLYVVSRGPDAVLVVSPETGEVVKQYLIPFKNPSRLKVFSQDKVGVEDVSVGLWIADGSQVSIHPAVALEAAGNSNFAYGIEYNVIDKSRRLLRASLLKSFQEPEVLMVLEPDFIIAYSKVAAIIGDTVILAMIKAASSNTISFLRFNKDKTNDKTLELPSLEAPYLPNTSWKVCSDGSIYGFEGNVKTGFNFYKATAEF